MKDPRAIGFWNHFSGQDLEELLVVSQVTIGDGPAGVATDLRSSSSIDSGSQSDKTSDSRTSTTGTSTPEHGSDAENEKGNIITHEGFALELSKFKKGEPWSISWTADVLGSPVKMTLRSPALTKCARCWRYQADPKTENPEEEEALCGRCSSVVESLRESPD